MSFNKNMSRDSREENWVCHACVIVALVLCHFKMPYWYYIGVKWGISFICISMMVAYTGKSRLPFILLMIVFNPFDLFSFEKTTWLAIDGVVVVFLLVRIYLDQQELYKSKNEES